PGTAAGSAQALDQRLERRQVVVVALAHSRVTLRLDAPGTTAFATIPRAPARTLSTPVKRLRFEGSGHLARCWVLLALLLAPAAGAQRQAAPGPRVAQEAKLGGAEAATTAEAPM